ncbi:universal stress protein [Crateriforma conspicua]|uniref:Putative universal stress protein n=1 Tax=Crateriforma conspicua TaxID=2527996 RepID=A0A5C5YAP8_9PLAN|nr:universal stress protein [Crateriforma conspicua]TWT72204.1 putative universal stress protein [Crateriforma conspicua]
MKRIVIATDGSANAEEAAWLLSHLPHRDRLEITIATVIHPPSYSYRAQPVESWLEDLLKRERDAAEQSAARIRDMFEGANVSIDHVAPRGSAGPEIVRIAEQTNADLVVIGARGHSTVSRIMLGSTSDYVATHAPCSVLVVRPTGLAKQPRQIRITVGYEDSGPARAAIEELRDTHWGKAADVSLVSVVPYWPGMYGELEPDPELSGRATEHLTELASELAPHVAKASCHVIEGQHIGEALVRFAEDERSDLVVAGETPRGLLGRLLMGSVSRYVLRHAPCSVWITRNRMIEGLKSSSSNSE